MNMNNLINEYKSDLIMHVPIRLPHIVDVEEKTLFEQMDDEAAYERGRRVIRE